MPLACMNDEAIGGQGECLTGRVDFPCCRLGASAGETGERLVLCDGFPAIRKRQCDLISREDSFPGWEPERFRG